YPFPSVTADNRMLIMTGQGVGRRGLVILDPDYLYETRQSDDFSAGLEAWSVFGTKGVLLAPHPQQAGRKVLQIRRADVEFPAAAVWNFPAGNQGTLKMRMMLTPGFGAGRLALTDHFSVPYDQEDQFYNMFNVPVCLEATPAGRGAVLRAGQWHDVELRWDFGKRECRLLLDNQEAGVSPLRREGSGISYLRLSSLSGKPETGALLLESVSADVSAGPWVAFNS
ncbi:MAG: hypothetical protein HY343_03880, partial [Lentisphaerae bacterium]|nr:hypothetical protein [Lentisphaerota bacterium]